MIKVWKVCVCGHGRDFHDGPEPDSACDFPGCVDCLKFRAQDEVRTTQEKR